MSCECGSNDHTAVRCVGATNDSNKYPVSREVIVLYANEGDLMAGEVEERASIVRVPLEK